MATPLRLLEPIIIVGGGTFGTSTAYHLVKKGYKSVTVLDRWAPPSAESAGNDYNKIVRSEYTGDIHTILAEEAKTAWKQNPLFDGIYNESGWILAATHSAMPYLDACRKTQQAVGLRPPQELSPADVHKRWPILNGPLREWKPYYNANTAWVNAREGLRRMATEAIALGAKYISGDAGHAILLLFDESSRCVGVKCNDGTTHFGSHIVLAAGAAAGTLLDLEGQIVAKAHSVCHIQLSLEEADKYKNLPIICHMEEGILFPPQKDGIIKVTTNSMMTNYGPSHPKISLPRYGSDNPQDVVPKHKQDAIRQWMKDFLPDLAEREWSETRFCWDGDTVDDNFLISSLPEHKSLSVAIGGSAHGFKFLPIIGKYIVNMMEGNLDLDKASMWKWRPSARRTAINPFPMPLDDLNDCPEFEPVSNL